MFSCTVAFKLKETERWLGYRFLIEISFICDFNYLLNEIVDSDCGE